MEHSPIVIINNIKFEHCECTFYSHTLYIGHHINTGLYALPAIADTGEVNPLVDRGLIVLLDKTSFSVLPYYSGNDYNVEPKNVENHTILLGNANK